MDWKIGDRFALRYDFSYGPEKLEYKAGETGVITYAAGPPIPVIFGVFDSTPHQYPLPLSFKAVKKLSGRKMRKNPKTRELKRKELSRTAYVTRPSQITKRSPTKRLRQRRETMTLMRERGFEGAFPNPSSHDVWVQIQRSGKWFDVDGYGSEAVARAVAEVFGKAGYTARVVRK
jgi:hypothetical protein